MRKYSLYIIFGSLFCSSLVHADIKFGVLGGGNFTTFLGGSTRSVDLGGPAPTTYSGSLSAAGDFGYQFGAIIRYDQPKWSVDVNAIYTSRSLKHHGTISNGTNEVRNSVEFMLRQLEVPVIGYYKFPMGTMNYRFGLGLYAAYGLGKMTVNDRLSNVPGSVQSTKGDYAWDKYGFKKFNVGGLAAFGIDFTSRFGAEIRGITSFTDYGETLNPNNPSTSKIGLLSIDLLVTCVF